MSEQDQQKCSRQASQVVFDILSVILKDNNKIMYVYGV